MTELTLVGNRIKLKTAEFRPVTASAMATGIAAAGSPAAFVGQIARRYERWLNALSPVARDWLQPALSSPGDTIWQQTNRFAPRLALTFLTRNQAVAAGRTTAVQSLLQTPWNQLPLPSLSLVDQLLRQTDHYRSQSLLQPQQLTRLEQRFTRLEGDRVLRESVAVEPAQSDYHPQPAVELPAPIERVFRQTAVIQESKPAAPTSQPANEPPGWGRPFPPAQDRQPQTSPTNFSPGEINRLTDQVMTQIDRRLLAHRERTGRV